VSRLALARLTGKNPPSTAVAAASLFFPQSKSLGIDLQSLSPGLLDQVVYAGSNLPSFAFASDMLDKLADQDIDPKVAERACHKIGGERLRQRHDLVEQFLGLPLAQREVPVTATPPDLAVVMADGAFLQIRRDQADEADSDEAVAAGQSEVAVLSPGAGNPGGPVEGGADAAASGIAQAAAGLPGVAEKADEEGQAHKRQGHWREEKVGLLLSMESDKHEQDPCPQLPEGFRDPLVTIKLVKEVGHQPVPPPGTFGAEEADKDKEQAEQTPQQAAEERAGKPKVVGRRVVATRQKAKAFGPILAAAAWGMGMFQSERQAMVGDGSEWIWNIHRKYFPRFEPIADFIHAMSYVFVAAMAGRANQQGWQDYQRWLEWLWAGEGEKMLKEIEERWEGMPEGKDKDEVAKAWGYLKNNQERMKYAQYRKDGLPIMSSLVESVVKQLGRRVKGTEKFWTEEGAEALLQLRADYLSDEAVMGQFWQDRAENATGFRPYRQRKQAG